jgi:hypothetical protein
MLFFQRLLAALPDVLTAAVFLCTWADPALTGYSRVKNLMLTMLFEFIVMHSAAIMGSMVLSAGSRGTRIAALCGLTACYMLFVLAFSFAFESAWPIVAFGWLFVCRFSYLLTNPTTSAEAAQRMQSSWAISGLAYLICCGVTLFLPLPRLGMTPEVVAEIAFPKNMTGAWIDRPWIVLAFGALYFGVQAWCKLFDIALPAWSLPSLSGGRQR